MSNTQSILSIYAKEQRKRRRADFLRRWRNRIAATAVVVCVVALVVGWLS